ncbi:MAG: hypothetical protein GXP48_07755 [Acidobacteria bacterium]|nr:hypothetical protein [Acidobacteriota bacterium]
MASFDIFFLSLRDPSKAGRLRFVQTLGHISDKTNDEIEDILGTGRGLLFERLSRERANAVVKALGNAGARLEIRPNQAPPAQDDVVATRECPRCGFIERADAEECSQCGLVFAKWEREQIRVMQREKRLEEAMAKALQVRQKWTERATEYVAKHPLSGEIPAPLQAKLSPQETVFMLVESEEGPLVLTSRRCLCRRGGFTFSVPWELMAGIDFGGGLLKKRGDFSRMQMNFHGPVPIGGGETAQKLMWQVGDLDATDRDTIMSWAYARKFPCGACGETELHFQFDGKKVHGRCMHCATDHEIDLEEALAIPILAD